MKPHDIALPTRPKGSTITQWLYDELRRAILEGRLRRGAALPPTRRLAQDYVISRRIVVNVFNRLRDEGYLETRAGSGARVSASLPEDYTPPRPPKPAARPSLPTRPARIRPFRPVEPALAEFPIETWARLTARITKSLGLAHLAAGSPAGEPALREAIAAHLGASRGVACHPAQIVIVSGAQQGLDLLARALLRPGDKVWMEDPGYIEAAEIFRRAGAAIVPVPVDADGLDFAAGLKACPRPRAVYLTPAHQFPTGVTLALPRRLEILNWARRHNVAIFEDDYDSEFRFSGRPLPAMKGLPGADQVCLVGTFNKALFPALRLGYLALPDQWLDPLLRLRSLVERHPAVLPQQVLAAFIDQGQFATHLRRMRRLYADRLQALRQEIGHHLEGVLELPEIEAGLNIPARLLNGMSSTEAAESAANHDVEVWPLDRFSLSRRRHPALLLGFAAFDRRAIRRGAAALAQALR
ncbi:MAG: PLP-dependent aminotransferase family protein [Acidobacteria bacterium]|nr:PLP-dependent aminotransferase family protein [Acidobacteriota bacterium]